MKSDAAKRLFQKRTNQAANNFLSSIGAGKQAIKLAPKVVKAFWIAEAGDILQKPLHDTEIGRTIRPVITGTQAAIMNQTIGRIPILGDFFRWVNNTLGTMASSLAGFFKLDNWRQSIEHIKMGDPNLGFYKSVGTNEELQERTNEMRENKENSKREEAESKSVQEPKWYGNLSLHKAFNIPASYPKHINYIDTRVTMPTLAVHVLKLNPMPNREAATDRFQQLYTLVKAVRGLSSTSYDIIDIANFTHYSKALVLYYYNLKTAIRAAKTFNLVNVKMGDMIIAKCGYECDDFRTNLANYEALLGQLHNFIETNVPMSGYWIERCKYIATALIPDYQDGKLASYHTFGLDRVQYYYRDTEGNDIDRILNFYYGEDLYEDAIVHIRLLTQALFKNKNWADFTADYFGAFGSKCIWHDEAFNDINKPLTMDSYDTRALDQIKNATYLAMVAEVENTPSGAHKEVTLGLGGSQKFYVLNGSTDPWTERISESELDSEVCYSNLLQSTSVLKMEKDILISTTTPASAIWTPQVANAPAYAIDATNALKENFPDADEFPVTLHKERMTEEEYLEVLQFKAKICEVGAKVFQTGSTTWRAGIQTISCGFDFMLTYTAVMRVEDAEMKSITLCPMVFTDHRFINNGMVDSDEYYNPSYLEMWSMNDWMPKLNTTFRIAVSDGYFQRAFLWDVDNYGDLSARSLYTAVYSSQFSLLGANLAIAPNTKRVNNLGEAYKDKTNRKF